MVYCTVNLYYVHRRRGHLLAPNSETLPADSASVTKEGVCGCGMCVRACVCVRVCVHACVCACICTVYVRCGYKVCVCDELRGEGMSEV